MVEDIKIQTVCGFGCGSSLLLRMNIEEVLKENNLKATIFCGDLGTCLSQPCNAIFISEELCSRIEGRTTVTIVPIKNFMDKKEITAKTMEFMNSLIEK